jgi:hypothetical protein
MLRITVLSDNCRPDIPIAIKPSKKVIRISQERFLHQVTALSCRIPPLCEQVSNFKRSNGMHLQI